MAAFGVEKRLQCAWSRDKPAAPVTDMDEETTVLRELPSRMQNFCKARRSWTHDELCVWRDMETPTENWASLLTRAIALPDKGEAQRAVNIIVHNEALHNANIVTPLHVADAVRRGLAIDAMLVDKVTGPSRRDLGRKSNPFFKAGLVACAEVGDASMKDTLQCLLRLNPARKVPKSFPLCMCLAVCLVPDVLDVVCAGVRRGDPKHIALYGMLGPVLCDGGAANGRILESETDKGAHDVRITRLPAEPMFAGSYNSYMGYFKISLVRLDDMRECVDASLYDEAKDWAAVLQTEPRLHDRLRMYAWRTRAGGSAALDVSELALLLKGCDVDDGSALAYAACAAMEANNLPMLQAVVESLHVTPSRGLLMAACTLQRGDAVAYLLLKPEFDACL